jgi:urease accessory protein
MLTLTCKLTCKNSDATPLSGDSNISDSVALPYDIRCRTRLRVTLASGREAGIVLARRERLRHGDVLRADDGTLVEVVAAPEPLLEVTATELLALTRAAYHLGNRHVPVEIVSLLTLRLPVDHVLADMLRGLGLVVRPVTAPFNPEGGAYAAALHELHETDHSHLLDRETPIRIRRAESAEAPPSADAFATTFPDGVGNGAASGFANIPAGLVDPGVGDHRSPRRIHDFEPERPLPPQPVTRSEVVEKMVDKTRRRPSLSRSAA